jgi:hypothetical protein
LKEGDLFSGEAKFVGKFQFIRLGQPWRHETPLRDRGDLPGMGFASLYVSSGKGAASPGRWHVAQEWNRIGAMSRLKVTRDAVGAGSREGAKSCCPGPTATVKQIPKITASIRSGRVIRGPK